MKKLVILCIAFALQFLLGCETDNPAGAQIDDYLEINGINKNLILSGEELSFFYSKHRGGFDLDTQPGNYTSIYYDIILVYENHEFIQVLNPEFTEKVSLRFITNLDGSSGDFISTTGSSALLDSNQVVSQLIIDSEMIITASGGQTFSITTTSEMTTIQFSNVHYGSNMISGRISYPNV